MTVDNTDMYSILSMVEIKHIIDLFYAILLEEKIVILCDDLRMPTLIAEALFSLLYPFKPMNYTIISIIAENMIDYLDAPIPYVIGCSQEVWNVAV